MALEPGPRGSYYWEFRAEIPGLDWERQYGPNASRRATLPSVQRVPM